MKYSSKSLEFHFTASHIRLQGWIMEPINRTIEKKNRFPRKRIPRRERRIRAQFLVNEQNGHINYLRNSIVSYRIIVGHKLYYPSRKYGRSRKNLACLPSGTGDLYSFCLNLLRSFTVRPGRIVRKCDRDLSPPCGRVD